MKKQFLDLTGAQALVEETLQIINNSHRDLTIKFNGASNTVYNGKATKEINITPVSIGAAATSHTHPNIISSGRKIVTASGTTANATVTEIPLEGISIYETYNDPNTPTSLGNIINIRGITPGGGQLLLGWSGSDSVTGNLYYRSHRDSSTGGWGSWQQLAYVTSNVESATRLNTARYFSIGSSSKAFDGTASIAWSLAEIGAAAASHTHSYLPLTGGALSGNLDIINATPILTIKNSNGNDSSLIFDRVTNANWKIVNSTGDLNFQSDYTSAKGSYYSVLTLKYNTGNAILKGTLTAAGFVGNATSATTTPLLGNLFSARPTSANIPATGSGGLSIFKATGSMTVAKPGIGDAHIFHMYWDNTGGWDSQIALSTCNPQSHMQIRGMNNSTWSSWLDILDQDNYTKYTVTKTGLGASGTWGINITGNAASATKATQDGSGNTITSKYTTLDTAQSISGQKTFTAEVILKSANAIRAIQGNYGFFIRNDGNNIWFMLTNSGDTAGSYNSLRPLSINNSNGLVSMANGLYITSSTSSTSKSTGALRVSGGVGVAGALNSQSVRIDDTWTVQRNTTTGSLDFILA